MVGYLTPNTLPPDTICRALFIPNNEEFLANVTGALQALIFPENWTQYGTLTPDQSAAALVDMFDKFCFNQGVCRMVGEIITFAGGTAPDPNWLLCDGTHVSNATYPDLYSVIGLNFGGTGPADFALPDLRGNVPLGAGSGFLLGSGGGEGSHLLTNAEVPSHTHVDTGHVHAEGTSVPTAILVGVGAPVPSAVPGVGITGSGNASLTNSGGGMAHNNLQPYLTLNFFIVAADG